MKPGARPGDWETQPMGDARTRIEVSRSFLPDEMERLRGGVVPEEMEDKWFIVHDDGALVFHRSWTGRAMFRATFEPDLFGERIASVELAREPEAAVTVPDAAAHLFEWIVDALLLGREHAPREPMQPQITAERGDITTVEVDAIVNAANEGLLGGGGVDGAIHRAAGPELLAACRKLPEARPRVRCPTGEARATPAFGRLRARHVIHAVGPIYGEHVGAERLLASAFRSSLDAAERHGALTVAFPAISCGVYSYPIDEASRIAVAVARERPRRIRAVRFVLFDDRALAAWQRALG